MASDIWQQLKTECATLIKGINISENITYTGPSKNPYHPYGTQGYQSLSLDFSGDLYVHNNVKYGKTYYIKNAKKMLDGVCLPVIITVAKSIEDQSVWQIIEQELVKTMKRRLKDSEL